MLRSSGAAFLRGAAATLLMLLCVRWYVAYSLSLRNLEEMMAERAIGVDHSTVHRWVIKLVPLFEKMFRKLKRPVGKSWRMDETYIKGKGSWKAV
jgi:transposase-like protein